MSRYSQQPWIMRHGLSVAAAVALVLSLTPTRFLGWVRPAASLVDVVAAPISAPLLRVGGFLRSGASPASDGELSALERELEGFRLLYRQEVARADRLAGRLEDLQRGSSVVPSFAVSQLWRPVVGHSSDLSDRVITVRLRGDDRVAAGEAVAALDGVDLLGRVIDVSGALCKIRPATDRESGLVSAVAEMESDGQASARAGGPRFRMLLEPQGDGTFIAEIEAGGVTAGTGVGDDEPRPARGMTVRLSDSAWPRSAQLLIVGTIVSVEPKPENPLRLTARVEPRKDGFASEVILRVPTDGIGGDAGGRDAGGDDTEGGSP